MTIRSKMNKLTWRQHFPIIILFRRSRAANSVVSCPIWPKFKLIRDFMHVLITGKYKTIGSNRTEISWMHRFPHYKSMGAFCCHGNHSFNLICPKTLCSLSPSRVMLHIKFDKDWPTGFRDIKFESVDDDGRLRTTDHWYTISSPCEPSAQVS